MGFCGPFVPPDYVECFGVFGFCTIDNEPEDELECWCADGSFGAIPPGGMMWAGFTDPQLAAECEIQLDTYCMAPPMSQVCSNGVGECTIASVPNDFLACECGDGSGGSFGGGNAWAGYSELQLHAECGNQLVGLCGGPQPPALYIECSSELGDCTIDNDPDSVLDCTCADGEMFSGDPGKDWSGLSDPELLMECEAQLSEGCAVDAGSSTGGDTGDSGDSGDSGDTGDTGDSGDTDAGTGDTGVGTGPGDPDTSSGGEDDDGSPLGSTGADGTDGLGSESGDGGAVDDGDGGCSCSATRGSDPSGLALALLGLMGWRRRRVGRARRG